MMNFREAYEMVRNGNLYYDIIQKNIVDITVIKDIFESYLLNKSNYNRYEEFENFMLNFRTLGIDDIHLLYDIGYYLTLNNYKDGYSTIYI